MEIDTTGWGNSIPSACPLALGTAQHFSSPLSESPAQNEHAEQRWLPPLQTHPYSLLYLSLCLYSSHPPLRFSMTSSFFIVFLQQHQKYFLSHEYFEFIYLYLLVWIIGQVVFQKCIYIYIYIYIYTFMHLADAFIQSDLQCIQAIHVFCQCVPWESNPQPLRC